MENSSTKNGFQWNDELIDKLIQMRYDKREEFKKSGKRTIDVWMRIVRDLQLGNQVSALECHNQWRSLLQKFKDIETKIASGSCSEELSWRHYNKMQIIMNELSAYEGPSILATGNDDESVRIQFSDSTSNDDEIVENRATKRERRDVIDERFISAVEEGNRELKAMHLTLERQGDEFLQLMSRYLNLFENQTVEDMSM